MTEVVTFNVGGQLYQVSRTLLSSHPETMLAKSASERWQDDSDSDIFIERDGEMFRHVLSYLRDGRVDLPLTIRKKGLLSELKYYGVEDVDDKDVDDGSISQIPLGIAHLRTICDSWKGSADALNFANLCIQKWHKIETSEETWNFSVDNVDLESFLLHTGKFREWSSDSSSQVTVECNAHLGKVGIQIMHITNTIVQYGTYNVQNNTHNVTLKSSN